MKNKKSLKLLTVLLFGVLIATGCSCTNSMCSEQDIANIKTQIEINNIDDWRESYSLNEGGTVYPEEFNTYYTDQGFSGTKSKAEVAKEIEAQYPGVDYTDESKEYVATRTDGFQNYVNTKMEEAFAKHPQACLTVTGENDPITGAKLESKTWGDAWKTGLLEGLIVFPLSWLLSTFSTAFGGQGAGQLAAIALVVLIVRVAMLVLGFKGQLGNMKMQELQPELQALQAKFSDPTTTDAEKQVLSTKMISIYKENNINPFSSFITMFIQFPIFIAIWAAMNQTVAIRTGVLFGLEFGTPVNEQIFYGPVNAKILAILLLVLMVGFQILSMKMPNIIKWIKERRNPTPEYKKTPKSSTQKQMGMMMAMMIGMVVLSAFVLPAALVIYWVLGSVFAIIQITIFSLDPVKEKLKALSNRKKKAKVVK